MGLRELIKGSQYRVIIDPFSIVCIFGSFFALGLMVFNYLPDIHENQLVFDLVIKSVILTVFLISGLVGMLFFGVYDPYREGDTDFFLDARELDQIFFWTGVDLFMIFLINWITFQYSPLFQNILTQATVDPKDLFRLFLSFSLISGWTEEVLFRGFALRTIQKFTFGDEIVAIVLSTLLWWGFHWGVYGLDLGAMMIILLSGFILSVSFIATNGRLSVVMIPHGINNVIATFMRGAFMTGSVIVLLRLIM
jgi:membrane protease YdiL (CAAX protease family)